MPTFKNSETSVKRRFSDFLGLHDRLNGKFLHLGRIVPPAPEKSVVGKFWASKSGMESSGLSFSRKHSHRVHMICLCTIHFSLLGCVKIWTRTKIRRRGWGGKETLASKFLDFDKPVHQGTRH